MRIAVSTIAKNEVSHAERWAISCADADVRLVADTGSDDGTPYTLNQLGVTVVNINIKPWRFDMARNAAMAALPSVDLVITLDMDEVLAPGWRQAIENSPRQDQYTYNYVWNWKNDKPDISFEADRAVDPSKFWWKHPVHEVLVPAISDPFSRIARGPGNFTIHHFADDSKPRAQYLPLLDQAFRETPNDDRIAHYYARELYFTGDWSSARQAFLHHIQISSWAAERAASFRYLAKMDDFPERWILKAIAEDPNRREPWVDLIQLYRKEDKPVDALVARVLTITQRPVDYMTESQVWDDDYIRRLA